MTHEPTVFIVDDDPEVRRSLQWLIESVDLSVRVFASAQEFLDTYDSDCPGCLVLDVRMPGISGLDLQRHLQSEEIRIPIIIVTAHGDVPMAVRAIKDGAIDFIEKPVSDQLILDLIQRAIQRDREDRASWAVADIINKRKELLTQREHQVMELVILGMSSKEIAADLGVSFKTIEAHRAKIMKKMQAKSVPQLIQINLQTQPIGTKNQLVPD